MIASKDVWDISFRKRATMITYFTPSARAFQLSKLFYFSKSGGRKTFYAWYLRFLWNYCLWLSISQLNHHTLSLGHTTGGPYDTKHISGYSYSYWARAVWYWDKLFQWIVEGTPITSSYISFIPIYESLVGVLVIFIYSFGKSSF